ncbi:MAG: signal peptidase I [uncultured DHVE6 group euryarchaeote]|jgi:hypothetical protein|nr:MAG: signal peptidase I [uncultured DHVE6 group euryarchaeote]
MKINWKKIWYFLWKDDSWESLLVSAALVLIIGKFILLPALGFMLGTQLPIVAVVSNSMDHDTGFNTWWENNAEEYQNFDINKSEFKEFKMKNGFNRGDAIIVVGKDFKELKVGDIIIFQTNSRSEPIIHRIIEKGDNWVSTKGDNNPTQLNFEKQIHKDDILGVAKIKIPFIGWVKVGFLMLLGKI